MIERKEIKKIKVRIFRHGMSLYIETESLLIKCRTDAIGII